MVVFSFDQEGLVDDIEVIINSVLVRHLDGMVRSDRAEAETAPVFRLISLPRLPC